MKIPPDYTLIPEIIELLSKIDALRLFFNSLNIPLHIKEKIQRVSLLKSSLFSARIEGNPLTIDNFESSSDRIKKKEILNIQKAEKHIAKLINSTDKISKSFLLKLHAIIMKDLSTEVGQFRNEMSAIFNSAGIAVYTPPSPLRIVPLIDELIYYINNDKERFPILLAFISHLIFEKIHPFLDGNGRIGRLLINAILVSKGFDFGFKVPFEEYLDEYKNDYYYFLDLGIKNTNAYLIFMLQSFLSQLEKIRKTIESEQQNNQKPYLPPRQEEIYNIIQDHKIIPFDSIRRRFLKVPARTLRYDLKKLVDKNLVVKIGKTKGSFYKSI